ncbi:peroxin [Ceratobasidium sp. 370]|nr:peroxin [Ceratobasidium sp. 370]
MAAIDALLHSEPILTRILNEVFRTGDLQLHALRLPLLAECGRAVHAAAANVLFHTVVLPDDDAQFSCPDTNGIPPIGDSYVNGHRDQQLGQARALVRNHAWYAPRLRMLVVADPPYSHVAPKRENTLFELEAHESEDEDTEDGIRPVSGAHLEALLKECTKLEEMVWASSIPPPDWICETLATYAPHLKRFTFSPNSSTAPVLKWDAPSISHLPPLTHLALSRLSQAGASALAANPPDARSLALDFVWLDDFVCERLARASVRKLAIGTGGTKLTDRGIAALMEGCEALEELEFVDVQGRLSKTLWANVELPPTLNALKISMSERGPHRSWTADHLLSLPSLTSLTQLTRISITRTSGTGPIDDVAVAKPVPREMVRALAECNQAEHLECDWWLWGVDELKELVEGCTLRITLDAPFAKLLTLTSSFAHLSYLARLYVAIPSAHAPSAPPSPTLNTPGLSPLALTNGYSIGGTYSAGGISIGPASIGSPTSSPLSLARSLKSPKLVTPLPLPTVTTTVDVMESPVTPGGSLGMAQSFGAGNMNERMETAVVDAVLPPLRDVRKFVRRCPKLVLLEWFGRTARGSWIAHREDAKSVAGVKVEYIPPAIVDEDGAVGMLSGINAGYGAALQASNVGLVPREGAEWTGPEAEAAAQAVRDYEAERDAEIERVKEARRRRPSVSAAVKEPRTSARETKTVARDGASRKRGATVSNGVAPEVTGKPRRRQSSAGEGLTKAKSPGVVPPSPCKRGARRSP